MTWPALPLFARVAGRPVILLGEGEAADSKRRLLERAGAVVVADHPDARLAVVAIEEEGEAVAAVEALRARGVLVNAVDRPALCDFTLPAIVDRSPVLVAIGTGGASAGLAAALRQRLEGMLPAGLGRLAEALFAARAALARAVPDPGDRRRVLAEALGEGGWLDPLGAQPQDRLSTAYQTDFVATMLEMGDAPTRGSVSILLTSPDPDELTLRQARLLARADRVIHTPDVPLAILARARADAVRMTSTGRPEDLSPGLTVSVVMA